MTQIWIMLTSHVASAVPTPLLESKNRGVSTHTHTCTDLIQRFHWNIHNLPSTNMSLASWLENLPAVDRKCIHSSLKLAPPPFPRQQRYGKKTTPGDLGRISNQNSKPFPSASVGNWFSFFWVTEFFIPETQQKQHASMEKAWFSVFFGDW